MILMAVSIDRSKLLPFFGGAHVKTSHHSCKYENTAKTPIVNSAVWFLFVHMHCRAPQLSTVLNTLRVGTEPLLY